MGLRLFTAICGRWRMVCDRRKAMEYYNDGEIIIRDLEERDIAGIVEG